ncbi:site-specific DNA-methyltransferase [uncultured Campylobacter sp.]|uniref:DNA-methyltransferase n=1 Tax=uncultured Campylobacter sp. TaxID=218934 RepID=UPI0028E8A2C8|nr:site-specific DNA-methyltransferase [uncultured Campylobacter sp.]
MKPISVNFINKIILGDCVKIMRKIPEDSISGCVTDPPYNYEFFGKNWNMSEIKRRINNANSNKSILVKNIPYGSGLAGGVKNERWYKKNRENILEYQSWIEQWGKELYRVLKPGAFVMVFNSNRSVAHIQIALENVGFYSKDMFIWLRNSGIPKGLNAYEKMKKDRYEYAEQWKGWHSAARNNYEAISVLQKPIELNYVNNIKKYGVGLLKTEGYINQDGFISNIFDGYTRDKKESFNQHITVKPIKLIRRLVEMIVPINSTNIIIDPFMGSGTTAIACADLGINFIGCELNQEYIEIAKTRVFKNYI